MLVLDGSVRDSSSSCEIDYVIVIKKILNPKGHLNCIIDSKFTSILLKGWILPIGGAASGRVCDQRGYPVKFWGITKYYLIEVILSSRSQSIPYPNVEIMYIFHLMTGTLLCYEVMDNIIHYFWIGKIFVL